ncbi:MAG: MFS transporter [Phycisphaerales bacterium]|nr:MFS transporter [Phycisphaerales bacterium]
MPTESRSHYKRELLAWAFLPMMMGAIEGGVVGVLTKRLFAGTVDTTLLDWAVAALAASQGFANISSFIWAGVSHGKNKIRFITLLKIAVVLLIAAVSFVPRTPLGLFVLLFCVVGTRICWAGVVTLRSSVWQANYPRKNRADVAGRIATVQAIVLASVGLGIGEVMDHNEEAFRWIYPVAASFGILGAWIYSKMRVTDHQKILEDERKQPELATTAPWKTIALLKEDPQFAKYMSCQFVFGLGNLMLTAPLVVVLSDQFSFDYLDEILIVSTIPIVLMPLSIPLWSRLLNTTHVIQFRAIHSWVFVLSSICFGFSVFMGSTWGLWIAAAIRGIGFGGGVLAWNLGHQDFAPLEQSGRYMGLHVTLTGIRGLIAPALGMWLYTTLLGQGETTGGTVFFIGAAISAVGGIGFLVLLMGAKRKSKQ